MSWDYGHDIVEPEYPEPTFEDHCAMSGHPLGKEDPETGDSYCHCWRVYYPPAGEPHDEYSGQCANLIDEYVSLLASCMGRRQYSYISESMRFDVGVELRHKTPAYLRSLITSLKSSEDQVSLSQDLPMLTEVELDFFERVGVHLCFDGDLIFQTFTARLGGNTDYIAAEREVLKPYSTGVLDTGDNLEVTRRAAAFYIRLNAKRGGWEHRGLITKLLQELLPLFRNRPDLIDAAAATINESTDMAAGAQRVLAMMDSEPLPATMMKGFL